MDVLLVVLGFLCLVIGIAGSVLPALPGPPLSYAGMLLLHFSGVVVFSTATLVLWALIVVAVQILDFIIPAVGTKKLGGSKYGVWGCSIGLVLGLFAGPLGILVGPFAGAVIGELLKTRDLRLSMKAGAGAFLGFLAGTLIKVGMALSMIAVSIASIF